MGKVILETKKLSKAFANKRVVSGVDFTLCEGEITALLGENGAGKSTFKNMLVGLLEPTEGTIAFDGKEMREIRMGKLPIAAVHQELSLFLNLTVAENICIESFPGRRSVIDWKACREEALKYMEIMDISLDPDAVVGTLGPGEQQLIEIAKAIRMNPRVLILDEPTASLTAPERERLFEVMRTLKKQNIGMIFITHFLDEVFAVCDRVTVLRNADLVPDEAVAKPYLNGDSGGACIAFEFEGNKTVTLLRLGGNDDTLRFHAAVAKTTFRVNNAHEDPNNSFAGGTRWPGCGIKLEDPDSFLRHATGHHYAIAYGDYSKELEYMTGFYGVKLVLDH